MKSFSIKNSPDKWYVNILILYLVFTVINWLPIVDASLIRAGKYIVFIIIFFYEIYHRNIEYPSLYLSPIGLIIILITMLSGMYLSTDFTAFVDIILPFLILWIFNFDKNYYYHAIYKASIIISLICLISIISNLTGIFDIEANGPWNSTFGLSGFGGYTTGYSDSLFLFIPFLVFWHRLNRKIFLSIETFAIMIIILAQYFAGGRAGLLASILVFIIGYKFSIIYKIGILYLIFLFIQSDEFLIHMRILNPYGDEIDIDRISSGRIGLNTYYYEKFLERPLFGYGFGSHEEFSGLEVHNVWLKNAITGGIFYLILLFFIFISIVFIFLKNTYLVKEEKLLFYSLFFISFIITFLEPNYLIGSVQGEFVYWLLISLLLKQKPLFEENNELVMDEYRINECV